MYEPLGLLGVFRSFKTWELLFSQWGLLLRTPDRHPVLRKEILRLPFGLIVLTIRITRSELCVYFSISCSGLACSQDTIPLARP